MITQQAETPVMDRPAASVLAEPGTVSPRSAVSANAIATTHNRTTREANSQGSKRFEMPEPEPAATPQFETPQASEGATAVAEQPTVTEKDLVQIFKLLADETRLKILLSLQREGELHVSALCHRLGQSQPAVSHHLALLRDADIIRPRRDGKHNYYSVRREYFKSVMGGLMDSMVEDAD